MHGHHLLLQLFVTPMLDVDMDVTGDRRNCNIVSGPVGRFFRCCFLWAT
jgi:hypothetical protein